MSDDEIKSTQHPIRYYSPAGRLLRRRPHKKHKVPKGGFTEDFIRHRMTRPKKTDHRRQIRYSYPLQTGLGLGLVVSSGGACSWYAITYPYNGKAMWHPLGRWPQMSCVDAKWEAENYFYNPQQAADAQVAPTLDELFEGRDGWLFKYVEQKMRLRSRDEIQRIYTTYVKPRFGHEQVYTGGPIDRTAISKLLDEVEERSSSMADKVLTVLSKLLGWHQANTHYNSPIVKGMRRYHPVARSRVLSDDELRRLWQTEGVVSDFCKFAILVGQRRAKLLDLRHGDIVDGAWCIRTENREKGNGYLLKLPQLALDIVARQKRADTQPGDRVFPLARSTINKRVKAVYRTAKIEGATIHDLRHCSKTWMSRAGVKPWISERVVGHKIKGVEGIYDNFEWLEEKSAALQALADLISSIVGLNVRQFPQTA